MGPLAAKNNLRSTTQLAVLVAAVLILGGGAPASAVPARPFVTELVQPNGTTFKARPYGDEWSNGYEALDGHTVIKNRKSGFWEYAQRRHGRLIASGVQVGRASPSGIPHHLRESAPARSPLALESPNLGSQPAIALLVSYTNEPPTTTAAQWSAQFFGTSDSVRNFYHEVSYDQLDLTPAAESDGTADDGIVGWLNLGPTHPNTQGFIDARNRDITRDAIVASNAAVDYASFDTNADGFISTDELHVTVIVAGHETSYGGPGGSCGNAVWGHNWWLMENEIPTVDGVKVGDHDEGGGYNQFGEKHCESVNPTDEHMATIGIMVHEMGHDLQLPDLYDTDNSSEGIGEWSVMSSGSWTQANSTDYPGSSPVHMDAWSKMYEGWITPQQITGTQTGVALTQSSSAPDVVQLLDNPLGIDWNFEQNSGSGEYFLVENRQLEGYDAGLPGCGLLIWHIDETRTSSNAANATEQRKLVDLEEADGSNDLDRSRDQGGNRGDGTDPFLGPKVFGASSEPNSNLYSGALSDVSVTNVSSACSETMTADFSTIAHVLAVTKGGTGTGRVTGTDIDCGSDCSENYPEGTIATLTAVPSGNSKFVNWSGDCSGTGQCVVTMDADHSVVANFIGGTTTTLAVGKSANKIKPSGSVNPDHPGSRVTVTFFKRRSNGTWKKLATKHPVLNATSDYKATFNRPRSGRCKIKARFPADGDHLGSSVTKQFRC